MLLVLIVCFVNKYYTEFLYYVSITDILTRTKRQKTILFQDVIDLGLTTLPFIKQFLSQR